MIGKIETPFLIALFCKRKRNIVLFGFRTPMIGRVYSNGDPDRERSGHSTQRQRTSGLENCDNWRIAKMSELTLSMHVQYENGSLMYHPVLSQETLNCG